MSYRFYGGTRETSIERDMADVKWLREHGKKDALRRYGAGAKISNILTVGVLGLFVAGIVALAIWGFQNLNIEFNLLAFLFNPITLVLMPSLWLWATLRS